MVGEINEEMEMVSTNTLTCVYTINDKKSFEDENQRIIRNFKESDGQPWAITAISLGHEIHRLSLIEEAHDAVRYDLLDEIFGMVDPTTIDSISELVGY